MPRATGSTGCAGCALDVDSDELKKFRKVVDKYYKTHLRHGGASGETGAETGSETGAELAQRPGLKLAQRPVQIPVRRVLVPLRIV